MSKRGRSLGVYGIFDPGNQDKVMITFKRESSHDYTLQGACGVVYQGDMHFFGGQKYSIPEFGDFSRQHFVIERQRSGKMVKMTEKKSLDIAFQYPSCSNFAMISKNFPWTSRNIVILCFDSYRERFCFSFDGEIRFIADSKFTHFGGGLTNYKGRLLTVGGYKNKNRDKWHNLCGNQKTELMERNKDGTFIWTQTDFKLSKVRGICEFSLVTVPTDENEEFVLLIGGVFRSRFQVSKTVYKFNGTWSEFGELIKPRYKHNSIYWNGSVYVIGGNTERHNKYHDYRGKMKIEIWKIEDSQEKFETIENWPKLKRWMNPHLFVVPDSFFPDHET